MKHIPVYLIISRILFGFVILGLSFFHVSSNRLIIVALIILGILTDIFDGIIARHLNISTQRMRRLDSMADVVFWFCTFIGTCIVCPTFFTGNETKLFVLLGAEILTYIFSLIKFRKEVSTHALLSKIWTLTLLATLIEVVTTCNSSWLFEVCFYVGIISRIEVILILLVLKSWTYDVPSLYHAILLRQGKEIRRNKMLNG